MSAAAKMEACQQQKQRRGAAAAAEAAWRRRSLAPASRLRAVIKLGGSPICISLYRRGRRTDGRTRTTRPPAPAPSAAASAPTQRDLLFRCFRSVPISPTVRCSTPATTPPLTLPKSPPPPLFPLHFGVAQERETWRVLCTRGGEALWMWKAFLGTRHKTHKASGGGAGEGEKGTLRLCDKFRSANERATGQGVAI